VVRSTQTMLRVCQGHRLAPFRRRRSVRGGEFTLIRACTSRVQTIIGQAYADAGFDQGRRVPCRLPTPPRPSMWRSSSPAFRR
jgi:hypothetical protein